jgi:hypothetical protein
VEDDLWNLLDLEPLLRTAPGLVPDAPWTTGAFTRAEEALMLFVLLRFGLVGGIASGVVFGLFLYPITFQTSSWYAGGGYVALLLVGALALYAVRTSRGSRPLLDVAAD